MHRTHTQNQVLIKSKSLIHDFCLLWYGNFRGRWWLLLLLSTSVTNTFIEYFLEIYWKFIRIYISWAEKKSWSGEIINEKYKTHWRNILIGAKWQISTCKIAELIAFRNDMKMCSNRNILPSLFFYFFLDHFTSRPQSFFLA